MTTFKQDDDETPVIFRRDGHEVIAVFPATPWNRCGTTIACYTHVGQHGCCDMGWFRKTRPASPAEYADLKRELEGAPFGYRLKVYSRITPQHRDAFRAAVRAGDGAS